MNIQRVRNLTTGRLHTEMGHIYQDIEHLIGEKGIMTHMLPRACDALQPHLRKRVPDPRFWEDEYDTSHIGEIEVTPLTASEKADFWAHYSAAPDPLAGKTVIGVVA